jgi:bleomycin hydrolase
MTKEERLQYHATNASHAMCITGVELDTSSGTPTYWQVENSWGYYDADTPGEDGFLIMNDAWFDKYVFMVVIHKKFLSEKIINISKENPILVSYLDSLRPAFIN